MDKREKIAHLLRRFGLGASFAEMEFYDKLGVDATIDRLINYEKVDEGFDVKVTAFGYKNKDDRYVLQPPAVGAHWILRLLVTQRPLQEKLTLFWHDHFAVSASKVNQAPMMWQYVETLRKNANGNFRELLLAMSQDAAMIKWLDNDTNTKAKPNENFAREVMELFSLGIGNYTEKDIQEAARAYTGSNFRVNLDRAGARNQQRLPAVRLIDMIDNGDMPFTFQMRQPLHDTGMKSVLGNEGDFGCEDICGILAAHPSTAKYVPSKLWTWFAYENPEPKIVDRLAKAYTSSGMSIKKVLFTIVESDEFWSDHCVRKQIKNPVDFTIANLRMLGLGAPIYDNFKNSKPDDTLGRAAGLPMRAIDQLLDRQGMRPLFPPDVAGWDWGTAWISSATMVERIKLADFLFGQGGQGLQRLNRAQFAATLLAGKPASTNEEIIDSLLKIFDATVPPDRRRVLASACAEAGGPSAVFDPRRAGPLFVGICRVLFAAPEFQFC